jgi:uncharacterized membrane protein YqiK
MRAAVLLVLAVLIWFAVVGADPQPAFVRVLEKVGREEEADVEPAVRSQELVVRVEQLPLRTCWALLRMFLK